jgi:hypothetical protein
VRSCTLDIADDVVWLCDSCGVRLLYAAVVSANRFIPFRGEHVAVGKHLVING